MITFIIPTIGRNSLLYTLESLLNQTDTEWNAILVLDGINKKDLNTDLINILNDNRFIIHEIKKMGIGINSAGNVRNYGMSTIKNNDLNTEWFAFLDDDDTIASDYIEVFKNELLMYPFIDVYIYRMINNDNRIIPKLNSINFEICDVGISFIIKYDIYKSGIEFDPDSAEDFLYLNKIRKDGYKIMISPYIKYFVRNFEYDVDKIGKRGFINIFNLLLTFIGYLFLKNDFL